MFFSLRHSIVKLKYNGIVVFITIKIVNLTITRKYNYVIKQN